MARIVAGFGTSHTPMLNLSAEDWPRFVERDTARPILGKDGVEASYDALVARADPSVASFLTPASFTERHAQARAGLARLGQIVASAKLDALIVIGDDHKELYQDDNLPSVLVYHGATIRNLPPAQRPASWMQRGSAGYLEEASPRDYPVDAGLAAHLIAALIDADFDVAASGQLPDGKGEGHAFGFVHKRVMNGHAIPLVPLVLNTYYPPNQPTPKRCYRLGRALRAAVESYPGSARIGVMASGGLSHFLVDEELDGTLIQALKAGDAATLETLPRHKLNSGNSEIRNWICAAGAVEHLKVDWLTYVPGYRTPAGTGTGLCFASWA